MSKSNYHLPWPRRWLYAVPLVGRHLRTSDQKNQQSIRDERSRALHSKIAIENLEQTSIEPFYLYLRPFSSTGKLDVLVSWKGSSPPVIDKITWRTDWRDLETLLGEALETSGPLVGLGKPGEFIGAGRVAVADDDWKHEFLRLSRLARMVFVVPSPNEGTLWEITEIKKANDILRKTVFIIPPYHHDLLNFSRCLGRAGLHQHYTTHRYEVWKDSQKVTDEESERLTGKFARRLQKEAIKTLRGFAFHVPKDHHNEGLLLLFGPNGGIRFKQPFTIREPSSIVGELLDEILKTHQPVRRFSLPALRQSLSDFEKKI